MPFPSALPTPRTPPARAAPVLRWGILGTGWIARTFVDGLHKYTDQAVTAVGSRSLGTAQRFADQVNAPSAYPSYEALVAAADVDVVYVATPHNYHHPNARLALEAGKPVLVEKPLTMNANEARDLQRLATERGLFCMEALWTLFLPKYDVLRQLLDDGALGDIKTVFADHGQHFEPGHRILDPALAGGPMLDMMTYPVSFAHWVIGAPTRLQAATTWVPTGVTGQTTITYQNDDDQQAVLHASVVGMSPTTAGISAYSSVVLVDGDFYVPGGFTVRHHDGRELRYDEELIGHGGLHWQAAEVARRITAGETGSPLRPLDDSIATIEIMDEARRQIGERFVGE